MNVEFNKHYLTLMQGNVSFNASPCSIILSPVTGTCPLNEFSIR